MTERLDPNRILPANPQIDPEKLEEAREMLRRLRELGVQRKGYDLMPPFGGRRVTVREDSAIEPRPVRMRRPRDI
jgi:hypothetical protein